MSLRHNLSRPLLECDCGRRANAAAAAPSPPRRSREESSRWTLMTPRPQEGRATRDQGDRAPHCPLPKRVSGFVPFSGAFVFLAKVVIKIIILQQRFALKSQRKRKSFMSFSAKKLGTTNRFRSRKINHWNDQERGNCTARQVLRGLIKDVVMQMLTEGVINTTKYGM